MLTRKARCCPEVMVVMSYCDSRKLSGGVVCELLCFTCRWWSLSRRSSDASLCLSSSWNKIFLLLPSTEAWLRRKGETLAPVSFTGLGSTCCVHGLLRAGPRPVMSSAAVSMITLLTPSYRPAGCLAINNSRTSSGGSWWRRTCSAEGWT